MSPKGRRYRLLAFASVLTLALFAMADKADAQVQVQDSDGLVQWLQQTASDLKAYALQVKTYVGEQLSWVTQAQQYATQLEQYANQLQMFVAFVHNPTLGTAMGLLNMAGLGSSMPVNPYAMMQLVNGVSYGNGGLPQIQGILSGIGSLAPQSYALNHVYTPTDGSWNSQQIIANGNSIAGTQGMAGAAYTDLTNHAASFQALRNDLSTAQNPKDVQDAQAEIDLESIWTQNEGARLSAAQLTYEAQSDSRRQQADEELAKSLQGQIDQARANGIIQ